MSIAAISACVSSSVRNQRRLDALAQEPQPHSSVKGPYIEENLPVAGEGFSGFLKRKLRRVIAGQGLIEYNRDLTEQALLSGKSELKAPVTEAVTPAKPVISPEV